MRLSHRAGALSLRHESRRDEYSPAKSDERYSCSLECRPSSEVLIPCCSSSSPCWWPPPTLVFQFAGHRGAWKGRSIRENATSHPPKDYVGATIFTVRDQVRTSCSFTAIFFLFCGWIHPLQWDSFHLVNTPQHSPLSLTSHAFVFRNWFSVVAFLEGRLTISVSNFDVFWPPHGCWYVKFGLGMWCCRSGDFCGDVSRSKRLR